MFPAALAIVVQTFPMRQRGKALALFFGIAGGLTSVGPILGGYLTEWTWRSIFWINIPVAIIALVLIVISKPQTESKWAPMDYRGLVLIAGGVALSVFGFQQVRALGMGKPGSHRRDRRWPRADRRLLLRRTAHRVAVDGGEHLSDPCVLSREHGPGRLDARVRPGLLFRKRVRPDLPRTKRPGPGLYLLYFFLGFVVASQIGGRILDRRGAKRPVVVGCAVAAVGFALWAQPGHRPGLLVADLVRGPRRRGDGVHARAREHRRGKPCLDAHLRRGDGHHPDGPELLGESRPRDPRHGARDRDAFASRGLARREGRPEDEAATEASKFAQSQGQGGGGAIPHFIRLDFAYATRSVLFAMAGVMALAAIVARLGLERGLQEAPATEVEVS